MVVNRNNKTTQNKKIIYFAIFISIFLFMFYTLGPNELNSKEPQIIIKIEKRPPIKINNDFPSGKLVTVDVVVPFIAKNLPKVLDQLESWDEENALPCDEHFPSHYFPGAQSNLVFYLNFLSEPQIERTINAKVESSIWRKCFNQIKYIYANNTLEEDEYPKGISVQFYKYFLVGSPSDYFFWMETDVKPLKKNWQVELFRLVIETNEARGNKAFFMMGSTYISAIENQHSSNYFTPTHINGNALYWNNRDFYDQFLVRAKWNDQRLDAFDVDITHQLHDPRTWDLVRNIRQEFIMHDFLRNYNYVNYDKKEVLIDYPRTYFVHHSDGKSLVKK